MRLKTVIWLVVFSIAMGYMESAVVVYLREMFYPDGFRFPLVPMDTGIVIVELLREAATIIMLLSIGILSASTASTRFAVFIFCFAIWDLCYYFFLWVFLGWPESLMTWDILFLIPVPWVGPVLAPCIVAVTMLLFAGLVFHFHNKGRNTKLKTGEWLLFISGSLVVIISFIFDYLRHHDTTASGVEAADEKMLNEISHYIPDVFNWGIFLTGQFIICTGIYLFASRLRKNSAT